MHVIESNRRFLLPEEGLILGNGDLSVSVYQDIDRVIFRFGKGDVWDRRIDFSDDPKPVHIDELKHGINVEKWKCGPYGGEVEALNGTDNPERMRKVCQGCPNSYHNYPYPCPKPVGELAVHLPPDQMGMEIMQRVLIEDGTIEIVCTFASGVCIRLNCAIPPTTNVLAVNWKVENWTQITRTGGEDEPPVWFSLYRWADPSIKEYISRYKARNRTILKGVKHSHEGDDYSPLEPPELMEENGHWMIKQEFHAEPTFPDGFEYLMMPAGKGLEITPVPMDGTKDACLHILPEIERSEGWLAVGVHTTNDKDGALAGSRRFIETLDPDPDKILQEWYDSARDEAGRFWSMSSVSIADPLIENLWYETLHVIRSVYSPDSTPPGLFLPSTINDYSHWHGDYHTNYNIQEPFWGDYTSNHVKEGDAFFTVMDHIIEIGRKIARDYYNSRGVFIQITGYPIKLEQDPIGIVPMGRMVYMTGWVTSHYWWRYRYTMDKNWLQERGYPVIRDCALFFTDFMEKDNSGQYHAFPSNQCEDGFNGEPEVNMDRWQVMVHIRYALRVAIETSRILETDEELRAGWQDILDNSEFEDSNEELVVSSKDIYQNGTLHWLPPEFFGHHGQRVFCEAKHDAVSLFANRDLLPLPNHWHWYFGYMPWTWMVIIRNGKFVPESDFPLIREYIKRWHHPNGLMWGMSIGKYGRAGAWSESLGVIAPIQDMMLQSWDRGIHVFPCWPKDINAEFRTFRAEGAFLVSSSWKNGGVRSLEILSEKGEECFLFEPWPGSTQVVDKDGKNVGVIQKEDSIISFPTQPGETYTVQGR